MFCSKTDHHNRFSMVSMGQYVDLRRCVQVLGSLVSSGLIYDLIP